MPAANMPDIVTARSVLEHLPDNAEFLRERGGILKRGEMLIVARRM
jgi:2-polyprenyl-3-methyl-5-hydroxy-6-metoxy-1,4-benzoquinol methylase